MSWWRWGRIRHQPLFMEVLALWQPRKARCLCSIRFTHTLGPWLIAALVWPIGIWKALAMSQMEPSWIIFLSFFLSQMHYFIRRKGCSVGGCHFQMFDWQGLPVESMFRTHLSLLSIDPEAAVERKVIFLPSCQRNSKIPWTNWASEMLSCKFCFCQCWNIPWIMEINLRMEYLPSKKKNLNQEHLSLGKQGKNQQHWLRDVGMVP